MTYAEACFEERSYSLQLLASGLWELRVWDCPSPSVTYHENVTEAYLWLMVSEAN